VAKTSSLFFCFPVLLKRARLLETSVYVMVVTPQGHCLVSTQRKLWW